MGSNIIKGSGANCEFTKLNEVMARKVYENFELCLGGIAFFLMGLVLFPVMSAVANFEIALFAVGMFSVELLLMIVGTQIIDKNLFDFELIEHFF